MGHWSSRLRSWWDVNQFIIRTIRPPGSARVAIFAAIFIAGLVFWIWDLWSGAWIAAVVGFLGLGKDVLSTTARWFTPPRAVLKRDEKTLSVFPQLELTKDLQDHGYQIVSVPCVPNEFVARSSMVDSFLRRSDVALEENQELLRPVVNRIRENSKMMEEALRSQYRQSWGAHPPREFANEAKICLGQDLLLDTTSATIYRGSYFHSFLTNELVVCILESLGEKPAVLFRGSGHFPLFTIDDRQRLKPLSDSLMGNHIGISSLVHTKDRKIAIWRQSAAAQQNRGRLVPTGSGSCDWSDWTALSSRKSLHGLVAGAMEREFGEESHPERRALKDVETQTALLGFFRWIGRGGKPEFVGVSKADVSSLKLRPNTREVDAPDFECLLYPAATMDQLHASIGELLLSERLSVPLWVNLTCLLEALREKPSRWAEFLDLEAN